MITPLLRRARPGFLLLEALIGFALFAMFLTAVGLTMLVSQQSTASAGNRGRGIELSSRALEAVRMLRDTSWSNLTTGTHGIAVVHGQWTFSGSSVTSDDGYTTSVTLSQPQTGRMAVSATTTWSFEVTGSGTETLSEELTDWRTPKTVGNWASPHLLGSATTAETRLYNRVAVANGVAYVTSDTSGGGKGLYLYNVQTPATPAAMATGFDLGFAAHDVVAAGNLLYVATEDPSAEIKIYNLSDPSSLSASDLVGSYDLPGSGRARSLALDGNTLVVGQTASVGDPEVTILDVSDPTDPSVLSVIDTDSDVNALALEDSALYMATSDDTAEVRVADLSDIEHPNAPAGWGFNLTDVTDASAVAVTGTAAVVVRKNGDFVEEGALFDVTQQAVPSGPPGPWYWEAGGDINGCALDLTGRYAFVATGKSGTEFRVLDLANWRNGQNPVVATLPQTTGTGRGVFYDIGADRVYLVTQQGLYIYSPS